jgi:hypothetical protein
MTGGTVKCEAERATTAKAIAGMFSCGAARSGGHGARVAMGATGWWG